MHAFGLIAFLLGTAQAALRVPGPLSPRNASYRVQATLDPDAHTVAGRERITWRNIASGEARSLVFHLYLNAFKNQGSTFYRESRGRHRASKAEAHGWGSIDVSKIVVGGRDLTARWKVDDTLAEVALDQPVAPGATIEIDLEWRALLPKVFARTGYHGDFFAVAQWFPKIAVWDCAAGTPPKDGGGVRPDGACRWRAHQHHLNSEFFADYGVYDIAVTLPARYRVGATGVQVDAKRSGDQQTLAYHAEDVHDFVFVACPRFRSYGETYRDAWGAIEIELLSIPGHEANVPRHLAATRAGLDELARRFGPYPYARLTIVDVPQGGEAAGGMEYPTLFFTFDAPVPRGVHAPELVTMHELSHQYFYGLVGSDEVEEAWLDEGLTETMTDWGLSRMFGRERAIYDLLGHRLSVVEGSRLRYRKLADLDALETRAFDYLDNATYGAITYAKTNLVLRTLEAHLGAARLEAAMRHYYDTWRFKHPRIGDFEQAMSEGAGEDLKWFLEPALRTSQALDYQVLNVEARPRLRPAGLFPADGGAAREVEVPPGEKAPFTSEVVVHRKGEWVFPVELKVVFEDGREVREKWDGGRDGGRWKRWTYEGEKKVSWAQVNPDGLVALDLSRWNDGRREQGDAGPRRMAVRVWQATVSTLLSLVGF